MKRRIKSTRTAILAGGYMARPWTPSETPTSPVVARIVPFAGKDAGGQWLYTQSPRKGRTIYPGYGTASGGLAFLPPELDDGRSSAVGSATIYAVSGGAAWGAGTPDADGSGKLLLGFSWAETQLGNLLFAAHDENGILTRAVRFNQEGSIDFFGETNKYGRLQHANSDNREYTFPDASGTVVLSGVSPPGSMLEANRVAVTAEDGLLATDDALRWIASGATLELGIASGAPAGALKFFNASTPYFAGLQAGGSAEDILITLPESYPSSTRPVEMSVTGVLGFGQEILVTSTPRFAGLNLGLASETTGVLTLYNSASAKYTRIQAGEPDDDLTFTLPDTAGTQYQVIGSNGSGALEFQNVPRAQQGANYVIESGKVNFTSGQNNVDVAFSSAYSAAPVVAVSIEGASQGGYIQSLTTAGFTFYRTAGGGTATGHWIAYGTKV